MYIVTKVYPFFKKNSHFLPKFIGRNRLIFHSSPFRTRILLDSIPFSGVS